MWTKMGQSDYWSSPPPPGPQIAKDVNVATYEKRIIYCFSLLYLCLQCDEDFMTDTLIPLDSTYGSPGPPKN